MARSCSLNRNIDLRRRRAGQSHHPAPCLTSAMIHHVGSQSRSRRSNLFIAKVNSPRSLSTGVEFRLGPLPITKARIGCSGGGAVIRFFAYACPSPGSFSLVPVPFENEVVGPSRAV